MAIRQALTAITGGSTPAADAMLRVGGLDGAMKIIATVVSDVAKANPALGLHFGSEGTVGLLHDRRTWRVFTRLIREPGAGAPDPDISFGGASSADLGILAEEIEERLHDWAASLAAALSAGHVHQIRMVIAA